MSNILTLAETRKMSKVKIETMLGKYAKRLEELGMTHEEACEFNSSLMNLGIAAQERWNENKTKK